jgi:photosystem I P700 chlorophyll a apoprotein A2
VNFFNLNLINVVHHHLAIAVVFIIANHMYRTNFKIGHSTKEILEAHTPLGGRLGLFLASIAIAL